MKSWLLGFHPVVQALLATIFTWLMTAVGAAMVFLQVCKTKNDGWHAGLCRWRDDSGQLLVFAGASHRNGRRDVYSLLAASGGWFLAGGIFLKLIDTFLPHLHMGLELKDAEGVKTQWQRSVLLILAITLHNIPEGLAVGVAFGAVTAGLPAATITGAIALAIGIGIQNFPEGVAVSGPLRREGLSRFKCFWYGQLSGIVEPVAGVLGAAAVLAMRPLLPYALSFAAGAMIYVVVEELIPESQSNKANTDISTMGAMLGFAVMMLLDVALG